jgi:hypothetical protein
VFYANKFGHKTPVIKLIKYKKLMLYNNNLPLHAGHQVKQMVQPVENSDDEGENHVHPEDIQ